MENVSPNRASNLSNYENAIGNLFHQIGLSATSSDLIRSLFRISKGEDSFEASFADIANEFPTDATGLKKMRSRIRGRINRLLKWQAKHGVDLIVIEKGTRKLTQTGEHEYLKTKFTFSLLAPLAEAIARSDIGLIEKECPNILDAVKAADGPAGRLPTLYVRDQTKADKKCVKTKIIKMYKAIKGPVMKSPMDWIRTEVFTPIEDFHKQLTTEQNRLNFLESFEGLYPEPASVIQI
ncbi:MAG: hypothetical protein IPK01_00495 [Acidobacteria bacterium]|nr:hypothetical protein [Acidobacteriota bacterium]